MGYDRKEDNQVTEFNSNVYRLISLNKLLDNCNEYSTFSYVNGYNIEYLKLWRNTLKSIYREIRPKLNHKATEVIIKLFRSAIDIGKIFKNKKTPDGLIKILDSNKFKRHWTLLDKIEERLRLEADSKGMLMTNKNDPGSALEA